MEEGAEGVNATAGVEPKEPEGVGDTAEGSAGEEAVKGLGAGVAGWLVVALRVWVCGSVVPEIEDERPASGEAGVASGRSGVAIG
jgi:hypothetical protein